MLELSTLTAFFGWCTIINTLILVLTSVALILMRPTVTKTHGKMFKLSEQELSGAYFQYLANYKIAIIVLNLAPYIALRIIS